MAIAFLPRYGFMEHIYVFFYDKRKIPISNIRYVAQQSN